ncbi:type I-E CRISPR-associated protein Cas6/Cse3/CasE [Streptomyces sp. NPDC004111]|uniref:type I-E CRISPR-associated protein Cas6/Cse3/CasE n=1 Tax=Streptomyces sp. NPDC004111 TaxID=3364690 RepID=UPI0036B7D238
MTPTLTRIRLNLASRAVRRDLADVVQLHRTLMRLAPPGLGPTPRQQAGVLFRLESRTRHPTLLVQTLDTPHTEELPARYGDIATHDLTPLFTHLTPGRTVRYRITTSPLTHRPSREILSHRPDGTAQRGRGTPTPLYGRHALDWWQHRAHTAGLDVLRATLTPCAFPRRDPGGPRHTLSRFDGTARISDPTALADALRTGLGTAKSYGAGLLTLAPAPTGDA